MASKTSDLKHEIVGIADRLDQIPSRITLFAGATIISVLVSVALILVLH